MDSRVRLKRVEAALEAVVNSTVGKAGQAYFDTIVDNLCSWLDGDIAFIGMLSGTDQLTVRTLSMIIDGAYTYDFSYELPGSPCENVTEQGFCHFPERIAELFPEDDILEGLGASGYVGVPLRGSSDRVIGLLWVISKKPMDLPPHAEEVMSIIAEKAGVEIERKKAEDTLAEYKDALEEKVANRTEELKRSKQELERTKDKLNSILQAIPDIVYRLDQDGYITFINDAVKKYGYSPLDLLGKSMFTLVHPEDREKAKHHLNEHRTGNRKTASIHLRLLTRQQKAVPFDIRFDLPSPLVSVEAEGRYRSGRVDTEHFLGTQGIAREVPGPDKSDNSDYRMMVENANSAILQYDMEGRITFFNDSAVKLFGYTRDEVLGRPGTESINMDYQSDLLQQVLYNTEDFGQNENENRRKDGSRVWIVWSNKAIYDSAGNKSGILCVATDISELKHSQESAQKALEEKELLLREVHHRVKNNLQVIASILNLEMSYLQNKEDEEIFLDCQNRVNAMALVHQQLYESDNIAHLRIREYIRDLIDTTIDAYQVDPARIHIQYEIEEIAIGIDTGIVCGLIINELVSNSIKYAFPNGRTGSISILLKKRTGKSAELQVRDDGVGVPVDFDYRDTDSLGLKLVESLVDQIGGNIEMENDHGLSWKIGFQLVPE